MLIAVPSSFFAKSDDMLGPSTVKTLPAATVPNRHLKLQRTR